LQAGTTAACFHRVENFPCDKLILKMRRERWTKIYERPLMIKLGTSSGATHFDGLRRQIACLTSESEIERTFKKSEKVKRELFGITTDERVKNKTKIARKGFKNTPRLC
jgi:hypothetical protein